MGFYRRYISLYKSRHIKAEIAALSVEGPLGGGVVALERNACKYSMNIWDKYYHHYHKNQQCIARHQVHYVLVYNKVYY